MVRDVVDALDRAAHDERIVALVARAGTGGIGLAQIQEIRDAGHIIPGIGKNLLSLFRKRSEDRDPGTAPTILQQLSARYIFFRRAISD